MSPKEANEELQRRADAIEGGYEMMLAYAAQGLPSDQGAANSNQLRDHLQRFGRRQVDDVDGDVGDLGEGEQMRPVLERKLRLDGVHFDSAVHSPRDIGRKVMNRNLSDCAAMACLPAAAVATAALPRGFDPESETDQPNRVTDWLRLMAPGARFCYGEVTLQGGLAMRSYFLFAAAALVAASPATGAVSVIGNSYARMCYEAAESRVPSMSALRTCEPPSAAQW